MAHRRRLGTAAWVSLLVGVVLLGGAVSVEATSLPAAATVEFFTRRGCPHCLDAQAALAAWQERDPELVLVTHHVDRDEKARRRLEILCGRSGISVPGVPAFVVGEHVVVGFRGQATLDRLVDLWQRERETGAERKAREAGEFPSTSATDLVVETGSFGEISVTRLGLPLFTIVLGLIDGFNPCAMWVLLFLLSMLVNLQDRARMALVAGLFVVTSGVMYFLLMAAWLNVFVLIGVSRTVQVFLGGLALAAGSLHLKDAWGSRFGPSLQIPAAAKPGIYGRVRAILRAEDRLGAAVGVVFLAILVNLVELLCTAGFPALYSHVLASQDLTAVQRYGYLLLYNLAYVADDALIVGVAVATLSKHKLSERGGRRLKFVGAIVMLALGLLLLIRPEWLH